MKINKYLFIPLAFLIFNFSVFGKVGEYSLKNPVDSFNLNYHSLPIKAQIVFICTGKYAVAYHSRSDCPGLKNCKSEIKNIDEYTAINSLGFRACCRCWSNVKNDCKDDILGSEGYERITNNSEFNPYVSQIPIIDAMTRVGMDMQRKYDLRYKWIQNGIDVLVDYKNKLFSVQALPNCTNANEIIEPFWQEFERYLHSIAAYDFANDYQFSTIQNKLNEVNKFIYDSYNQIKYTNSNNKNSEPCNVILNFENIFRSLAQINRQREINIAQRKQEKAQRKIDRFEKKEAKRLVVGSDSYINCSKSRKVWLGSMLLSGAAGAFSYTQANNYALKYNNATTDASSIKQTGNIFYTAAPICFAAAGFSLIEYAIKTRKIKKAKPQSVYVYPQISPNNLGLNLTVKF